MARSRILRAVVAAVAVAAAGAVPAPSQASPQCDQDLNAVVGHVKELIDASRTAVRDCREGQDSCSGDITGVLTALGEVGNATARSAGDCVGSRGQACDQAITEAASDLGPAEEYAKTMVANCLKEKDGFKCAHFGLLVVGAVASFAKDIAAAVSTCSHHVPHQTQLFAEPAESLMCLKDMLGMRASAHKLEALGNHVAADCEHNRTACKEDVDAVFAGLDELDKAADSAAMDCLSEGADCSAGIEQFAGAVDQCKASADQAVQDCPTSITHCAKDALALATSLGRVALTLETAAQACAAGKRAVEVVAFVV